MAMHLSREPFGEHSLISVGDGRNGFSFIPGAAGYVHQVRLGGRDLLAQVSDGADLARNKYSYNLAIVPFPNRLAGGRYTWRGAEYSFEINDPETGTALHGFGMGTTFSLANLQLGRTGAEAQLRYIAQPDEHPAYPFLVQFDLTLTLDAAAERFKWRLAATNLEAFPVPVGMCWHPYFVLPKGPENWRVHMPPNQHVELKKALPTGRLAEGLSPKQATPIDLSWDDCFKLSDIGSTELELRGPDYGLALKQFGEVRYTQMFVPPMKNSLAIEPMSCGVNAFRDAEGEVSLAAGATRALGMEIALL